MLRCYIKLQKMIKSKYKKRSHEQQLQKKDDCSWCGHAISMFGSCAATKGEEILDEALLRRPKLSALSAACDGARVENLDWNTYSYNAHQCQHTVVLYVFNSVCCYILIIESNRIPHTSQPPPFLLIWVSFQFRRVYRSNSMRFPLDKYKIKKEIRKDYSNKTMKSWNKYRKSRLQVGFPDGGWSSIKSMELFVALLNGRSCRLESVHPETFANELRRCAEIKLQAPSNVK